MLLVYTPLLYFISPARYNERDSQFYSVFFFPFSIRDGRIVSSMVVYYSIIFCY